VPPDQRGLFHENDVKALQGFKKMLDHEFKTNLGKNANVKVTTYRGNDAAYDGKNLTDGKKETYWTTDDNIKSGSFEVSLSKVQRVKYVLLQEYILLGQRVKSFTIDAWQDNQWKPVAAGTTVGYKRIMALDNITTNKIRINILDSKACPVLSNLEVY
jgi:alpha-L-fucosidase